MCCGTHRRNRRERCLARTESRAPAIRSHPRDTAARAASQIAAGTLCRRRSHALATRCPPYRSVLVSIHADFAPASQMTYVAGVDFGTQSVRVSIVDHLDGVAGFGTSEYPIERRRDDPDFATQSHAAHMDALVEAMRRALADAGVAGSEIMALALDTTGSTVVPVGKGSHSAQRLLPLVRSPCVGRGGADHRGGTRHRAAGDPRLRRRLFVGMGFCQAAALAAAPSGAARRSSSPRSSIATWSRRCSRASPIPISCREASAPWATSGSGVLRTAACRRRSFWSRSIRCSPASAPSSAAGTRLLNGSPATLTPEWANRLGLARGDSDSGRRLRRSLGRDRRGHRRR